MSLNIVKKMLGNTQSPTENTDQKTPKLKKSLGYKEILKLEQKKRQDAFLLRGIKKKSKISKQKESNAKLANKPNIQNQGIIDNIIKTKEKHQEEYNKRIKVWKEEFHGNGQIANSIANSVFLMTFHYEIAN